MTPLGFLSTVLTTTILAAPVPAVDYQKKADAAAWDWHPERASIFYSLMNAPKEYEIAVIRPKDTFGDLQLAGTRGNAVPGARQGALLRGL
jgi:hypothetical protein